MELKHRSTLRRAVAALGEAAARPPPKDKPTDADGTGLRRGAGGKAALKPRATPKRIDAGCGEGEARPSPNDKPTDADGTGLRRRYEWLRR